MSHFLYIHKDLSGNNDWNKIGVALAPYSAVRLRQRFCSEAFALDHLYFGRERHIERLEYYIKLRYQHLSGKSITGRGQTELFRVNQQELVIFITSTINEYKLDVAKVETNGPYTANASGNCPFGVPSEKDVWSWAQQLVQQRWGKDPERNYFEQLFEVE